MYDERPYLGKILNIVEECLEVTVMHLKGNNNVVWPTAEDVLLYDKEQLMFFVNPPNKVTRFFALSKNDWKNFTSLL